MLVVSREIVQLAKRSIMKDTDESIQSYLKEFLGDAHRTAHNVLFVLLLKYELSTPQEKENLDKDDILFEVAAQELAQLLNPILDMINIPEHKSNQIQTKIDAVTTDCTHKILNSDADDIVMDDVVANDVVAANEQPATDIQSTTTSQTDTQQSLQSLITIITENSRRAASVYISREDSERITITPGTVKKELNNIIANSEIINPKILLNSFISEYLCKPSDINNKTPISLKNKKPADGNYAAIYTGFATFSSQLSEFLRTHSRNSHTALGDNWYALTTLGQETIDGLKQTVSKIPPKSKTRKSIKSISSNTMDLDTPKDEKGSEQTEKKIVKVSKKRKYTINPTTNDVVTNTEDVLNEQPTTEYQSTTTSQIVTQQSQQADQDFESLRSIITLNNYKAAPLYISSKDCERTKGLLKMSNVKSALNNIVANKEIINPKILFISFIEQYLCKPSIYNAQNPISLKHEIPDDKEIYVSIYSGFNRFVTTLSRFIKSNITNSHTAMGNNWYALTSLGQETIEKLKQIVSPTQVDSSKETVTSIQTVSLTEIDSSTQIVTPMQTVTSTLTEENIAPANKKRKYTKKQTIKDVVDNTEDTAKEQPALKKSKKVVTKSQNNANVTESNTVASNAKRTKSVRKSKKPKQIIIRTRYDVNKTDVEDFKFSTEVPQEIKDIYKDNRNINQLIKNIDADISYIKYINEIDAKDLEIIKKFINNDYAEDADTTAIEGIEKSAKNINENDSEVINKFLKDIGIKDRENLIKSKELLIVDRVNDKDGIRYLNSISYTNYMKYAEYIVGLKSTVVKYWDLFDSEITKLLQESSRTDILEEDEALAYHKKISTAAQSYPFFASKKVLESTKLMNYKEMEKQKSTSGFPFVNTNIAASVSKQKVLPGALELNQYGITGAFPLITKPRNEGYIFARDPLFDDRETRKQLLEKYFVALQETGSYDHAAKFLIVLFKHSYKSFILAGGHNNTQFVLYMMYELNKLGLPEIDKKLRERIYINLTIKRLKYFKKEEHTLNLVPKLPFTETKELEQPNFSKLLNTPIKIVYVSRKTLAYKNNDVLKELPNDAILISHDSNAKHLNILNDPIIHFYDKDTGEMVAAYYQNCLKKESIKAARDNLMAAPMWALLNTAPKRPDNDKDKKTAQSVTTILGTNTGDRGKANTFSLYTFAREENIEALINGGKIVAECEAIQQEFSPVEANYVKEKMTKHREILVPHSNMFSTIDINYNKQTSMHYDDNDFDGFALRPLTVFWPNGEKHYEGAYTFLADYNIAVDLAEGCVMWATYDKTLHCNTPLIKHADFAPNEDTNPHGYVRVSLVPFTKGRGLRKAVQSFYENSDDEVDIDEEFVSSGKLDNKFNTSDTSDTSDSDNHDDPLTNPMHSMILKAKDAHAQNRMFKPKVSRAKQSTKKLATIQHDENKMSNQRS